MREVPEHQFDRRQKCGGDRLWEGYHESRICAVDTSPESYITQYTGIRRNTLLASGIDAILNSSDCFFVFFIERPLVGGSSDETLTRGRQSCYPRSVYTLFETWLGSTGAGFRVNAEV